MSVSSLFTGHPASVGESYLQHMRMAMSFSVRMMLSGAACFIHALFPFLFVSTGSRCIQQLHESMVLRRRRRPPEPVIGDTARPLTG
jgi:hypothetical protein